MMAMRANPSLNGLPSKRRPLNDAEIGGEVPGNLPQSVAGA